MGDRLLRIGSAAGGVVAALGLLEVVLRLVASPEQIPRPRILADSFDSPVVARRQLEEGVALAHFSAAGARMTGNPVAGQGVTVVILGDSYVMAREVADNETMGAQLERTARANSLPLDVRQYGWTGATPAQYLYVAHDVIDRWHPHRVIVVLSDNDLDNITLAGEWPRLRVDASGNARVVGPPIDTITPGPYPSSLSMLTRHRSATLKRRAPSWTRFWKGGQTVGSTPESVRDTAPPPDSSEFAALPGAVVRALAKSYGPSLTIIYMARVGVSGAVDPTPEENRLLDACRVTRVSCVSTREDMLQARRRGLIAHGGSTRAIGDGHLNPSGHGLVAAAMWKALLPDPRSADRTPPR